MNTTKTARAAGWYPCDSLSFHSKNESNLLHISKIVNGLLLGFEIGLLIICGYLIITSLDEALFSDYIHTSIHRSWEVQ